jgi:hypothetical protein
MTIYQEGLIERIRDIKHEYAKTVEYYEKMKASGELTKDWGECSLICARQTLQWLVYIETGRLGGNKE